MKPLSSSSLMNRISTKFSGLAFSTGGAKPSRPPPCEGAVDNEKQGKGKANRKPKEQRSGFHGAPPAFGMAHLNISRGKESRFFWKRTLDGERQLGSRESISTPGDGRTL